MRLLNLFGALGLDSSLDEIKRLLLTFQKPLSQITGSGSNRLSVDINAGTVTTVSTVTTVTTLSTVSNQTNMGGVSAFELQKSMSHLAFANSVRSRL